MAERRRHGKGLSRILADREVQAHLDELEKGGGEKPLSPQDRAWLHEVRRVAGMVESGEVEASASIRDSIAYVLANPHRTIMESEAAIADPEIRAVLARELIEAEQGAHGRHAAGSNDALARRIAGLADEE
jgi:hypothetical protein